MPAALALVLLALLLVPAGAAAQGELPVDTPVQAPAGDQPAADDAPPQPGPAPACDPALEACGQPCAPDVDESCAPECDEVACETAPERAAGGTAERRPAQQVRRARMRPAAATADTAPVFRSASAAATAQGDALPRTGVEAWQLALAGVVLMALGLRLRSAAGSA